MICNKCPRRDHFRSDSGYPCDKVCSEGPGVEEPQTGRASGTSVGRCLRDSTSTTMCRLTLVPLLFRGSFLGCARRASTLSGCCMCWASGCLSAMCGGGKDTDLRRSRVESSCYAGWRMWDKIFAGGRPNHPPTEGVQSSHSYQVAFF